ncbi:MAG: response regulator transcription factor [Prevotella sp.]|nr:response regulator transcription factor [Prevotella sp.]
MNPDPKPCYHILALDDHPMVLEGISHILSAYDVSISTQTTEMLALLEEGGQTFDLFILDLELPDADGFEALKAIRQHCPQAAILIYTMHEEPWILARLARLDIQGVVSKAQPVSRLQQAVEDIRLGKTFFDEAFTQQLEKLAVGSDNELYQPGPAFQLSEREQQILQCLAEGLTTAAIADRLFISKNTVGTYRHRLMSKFDAHNVTQLISKAQWHFDNDL